MKMPSASSMQIGMTCPGSVSLPWVGSERSKDANLGTKLHACIEAYYDHGANEAERISIEEKCHAEWMMVSKSVFPVLNDVKTEHYFELNPVTCETIHLGKDAYEKYSKENLWIRGCADIIGRIPDTGELFVGDWKTGFGLSPPAENNWQLIVAALAFMQKTDNVVRGRIIRTKDSTFDEHVYAREFLLQKSDELVDFAQSIQEGTNKDKLKTGEHCKHCKSWVFCPAQRTAIDRCATATNLLGTQLDDHVVELAVDNIKQMEELGKKAKQKIREYIELVGGELKLSDGRVLIPAKTDGNYVRKR